MSLGPPPAVSLRRDGPRRVLVERLRYTGAVMIHATVDALRWRHRIELRDGVEQSYRWFLENRDRARSTEPGAVA